MKLLVETLLYLDSTPENMVLSAWAFWLLALILLNYLSGVSVIVQVAVVSWLPPSFHNMAIRMPCSLNSLLSFIPSNKMMYQFVRQIFKIAWNIGSYRERLV